MKTINNFVKEFYKAMDYAIEEHFPFPAHYSLTPGMINIGGKLKDGYEVRIFTQGKKKLIEYSKTISIDDFVDPLLRDSFINMFLNKFKDVILK